MLPAILRRLLLLRNIGRSRGRVNRYLRRFIIIVIFTQNRHSQSILGKDINFSIYFQAHLEKTEHDIRELSQNAVNLKSNYVELTELQHVLEKTKGFFTEVP